MAASLGGKDGKAILEAVADHELQLGRESGAVKFLELEAQQLRSEALKLERELGQRDRSAALKRVQRVKQQEAWHATCAQIEQQRDQASETLEDAVDDAEALCEAGLALFRAREREGDPRRKKAVGRLGKQLMASAGIEAPPEKTENLENLDSRLLGAMATMETLVGQRMLATASSRPLMSLEALSDWAEVEHTEKMQMALGQNPLQHVVLLRSVWGVHKFFGVLTHSQMLSTEVNGLILPLKGMHRSWLELWRLCRAKIEDFMGFLVFVHVRL